MCFFCKNEAIQTRHEAYPTYNCVNCGIYIIPECQIKKVRQKNLRPGLKEFRNEKEENIPLFFGTKENYEAYKEFLLGKENAKTKSKFIDIETL